MIERKWTEEGEKWVACTHIVYFRDGGKEDSQYTTDVDYWLRFAEKWADTFEVLTIEEVIWSDEQIERLKEIEDMPEGWSERYLEYVRNGTLHIDDMPDTHPFVMFALKADLENREKETLVSLVALAEKNLEVIELQKRNAELQEMNLVALQGVAELNDEVQKLKKEMEASAD